MAQPRQAAPRTSAAEDEQVRVINNLGGSVNIVLRAQPLANNLLTIQGILDVLYAQPAAGAGGRRVYDEALRALGGDASVTSESSRRANAIRALSSSLINGIRYLEGMYQELPSLTNGPALDTMLTSIQNGINAVDDTSRERYAMYRTVSFSIRNVITVLRGGTIETPPAAAAAVPMAAGPTQATQPPNQGVVPQEFSLRMQTFDIPGRIHQIAVTGGDRYWAVGGDPSPMQLRSFSDSAAAGAFVTALSFALAAQKNNEAQDVGCAGLAQAMNGVSNPQVRADPRFAEALAFLNSGQRDRALTKLRELDPLFNGIFNTSDRQVVIRLDNRFVTVFSGRATVYLDIAGSMAEFEEWLRSGDQRSFGRAVVTVGLTAAADYLVGSGQRLEFIGGQLASATRVPASGYAVSATPSVAVTTSAGRQPLRIIAHCNFGYRDIGTSEPITVITQTGTREQQRVGQQGAYLGIWGLEFQFPRSPTDDTGNLGAGFSVERVGAGVLGTDPRNALAYITFSRTHTARPDYIARTLVTPMYSGFMNSMGQYQPRPGIEVDPYNMSWQFGRHMLSLSPIASRVDFNTATQVWTLDNSAAATWSWSPAWELSARVGYLVDVGGSQVNRLMGQVGPGYIFGGLGLTWRPGAESRGEPPSTLPRDTVPTRVQNVTPLERSIMEAQEFVRTHTEDGDRGATMARDLAGRLERWKTDNNRTDLDTNESYAEGIRQLRAGNLRGGLEILVDNVPDLR